MNMTPTARFNATLKGESVDRLPVFEWAPWWDETLNRWYQEGLPTELTSDAEVQDYFGLDPIRQCWVWPYKPDAPEPEKHCPGFVSDRKGYHEFRDTYLFPDPPFDPESVAGWKSLHDRGEIIVWFTLHGFYWFPREILGVERHIYAYYDQADLLHEITDDLLEFNLKSLESFNTLCDADFVTIAEDMSYRGGPMISEKLFHEFLTPSYQIILPRLKESGMTTVMDSDGQIMPAIPWIIEAGFEGTLPLERQAGVDLREIRQQYPDFKLIGGFDKMTMSQGEDAMRTEFQELLPVMADGGYVPGVDHQTPPQVSLENYQLYLKLLREYAEKAVQDLGEK